MADNTGFTTAGLAQDTPAVSSTAKSQQQHHHNDLDAILSSPPISQAASYRHNYNAPASRLDDINTAPSPSAPSRSSLTPLSPVSPSPSDPVSPRAAAVDHATISHRAQDLSTQSPSSLLPDSPPRPNSRSRAATYQEASSATSPGADPPAAQSKRPASYPDQPGNGFRQPYHSSTFSDARSQGQRELLLPKTLSQSSPPDEKRYSAAHRPPPVSYKPPLNTIAAQSVTSPVRVPPIRGFRSSGSRKSLVLDMNANPRQFDLGDDFSESSHDNTLRALEDRHGQSSLPMTPPASASHEGPTGDDTGDVFMRIAREEPARRAVDDRLAEASQLSASRTFRSSHRRPLSTTVAAYHPTSPPRLTRRLSDQQDSVRSRNYEDDRASEISRITTYRSQPRERQMPPRAGEEYSRARSGGAVLRPSPLTPRSTTLPDSEGENPIYGRRRSSVTENAPSPANRTPTTYRSSHAGHGHTKSYNSSPLVRSYDAQGHRPSDPHHGVEGTESTASTTAPSTVWDELDDLKSRLHRLELTGKLPSTSGAAVSRLSDERPVTATTTVTTISSSPKRTADGATQAADTSSILSSHREAHPLLHSALTKSKPFLSPEIYRALESVASDAMGLSSLMGVPGQPGPISSGASTIGSGTNMTDRQLRRKADSVCRGLTELCVALGEEATQPKAVQQQQQQQSHMAIQSEGPSTPTVNKTSTVVAGQRKPSVIVEPSLPSPSVISPRAVSKFEERRNTLLSGSVLPSPRVLISSNPQTPMDMTANRRSSLLVSRTRRAESEDPEEGRRSSLLRTRRAGTEDPDEGRRTSVLVRNRRGTVGEDDDESRFRAPSRAITEVHGLRGPAREYHSQAQAPAAAEVSSPPISSLPRRRFVSSNLNSSRLAAPASYIGAPARKYLDKSNLERDNGVALDPASDDVPQRHLSLGPSMTIHRSGSLSARRQNRDSTITNASTTATAGGYR